MPTVTINSKTYNLERHRKERVESSAAHNLASGAFKKDRYGAKYRFFCGSDHFTATELSKLMSAFDAGTSFSFTDLDSNSYTVLFENDTLVAETNRDIPWSNRRYKVDFVLREV